MGRKTYQLQHSNTILGMKTGVNFADVRAIQTPVCEEKECPLRKCSQRLVPSITVLGICRATVLLVKKIPMQPISRENTLHFGQKVCDHLTKPPNGLTTTIFHCRLISSRGEAPTVRAETLGLTPRIPRLGGLPCRWGPTKVVQLSVRWLPGRRAGHASCWHLPSDAAVLGIQSRIAVAPSVIARIRSSASR